jgi:hypothetical protein
MVIVAGACVTECEKAQEKEEEKKREYVCKSACSSSDANTPTLPFFLLDYAMKKDEAHATVNEGKWRV